MHLKTRVSQEGKAPQPARHSAKWIVIALAVVALLAGTPLSATPTGFPSFSVKSHISLLSSHNFATGAALTHLFLSCLLPGPSDSWDNEKPKKKHDDDDEPVPEPGVILQLALGLLGVASLSLIFKHQESNPR